MKKLIFLFLTGIVTCFFSACNTELDEAQNNASIESDLILNAIGSEYLEIPYKAKFHTSPAEDSGDGFCSFDSPQDFWRKEHQVGGGNATHIGNYTIDLRFCFHFVLNDQGLPDPEGGFGEFTGGTSTITANNGDKLFTQGRGSKAMPIQDDTYVAEFEHIIDITGGTGRFENASGTIVNYGRIRLDGTGTDHVQEGTIILNGSM